MLCSWTLKRTEYISNFLASDCTSKIAATVDIYKEVIHYFGIAMFGGKNPKTNKNPQTNNKTLGGCIKSCVLKLVLQPCNFPTVMHFKFHCIHSLILQRMHVLKLRWFYLYLALIWHLPNAFPYTLKPTYLSPASLLFWDLEATWNSCMLSGTYTCSYVLLEPHTSHSTVTVLPYTVNIKYWYLLYKIVKYK